MKGWIGMSCGGSHDSNANAATISDTVKNVNAMLSSGRCPVDGDPTGSGHRCPPAELREFAKDQDAQTAALYEKQFKQQMYLESAADELRRTAGQTRRGYGRDREWSGTLKEAYEESVAKLAAYDALSDEERASLPEGDRIRTTVLRNEVAEYEKRRDAVNATRDAILAQDAVYNKFRWHRAFLVVTNGQGHVHSSMQCSTCYPTTKFVWLPEYSGDEEENIVADAGERACSVCYKSAPVETFNRPTKIFSEDERKQMEEREAKKVEREAKKIKAAENSVDGNGGEFAVTVSHEISSRTGLPIERKERFKTERSATTWAVDKLSGTYREPSETELEAINSIVTAIAGKRGVDPSEVQAEFDKKAAAKRAKNEKEAAKWRR